MRWIVILLLSIQTIAFGQVDHYKLYNISREEGLPTENVRQIFQDSYGFLWIASFDGLFRWDGTSYRKYIHDDSDQASLSHNVVYVVFEDHQRRLWIGTLRGLDLYNREQDNFKSCIFNKAVTRIAVNAIVQDSKQRLWLGASNGLYQYNVEKDTSIWYRADGTENALSDHVIFGLAVDQQDNLWIGTFHGGVNKFYTASGRFQSFRHDEKNPASICSDIINVVGVDQTNRIWIGSYDKGISVLDSDGKVLKHHQLSSNKFKIQNIISAIYQDKHKRIWVGAIKEQLHYLDEENNQLVPFKNTPYKKVNIQCESITHIGEDNFGNLWFGTQTEGMFYTNESKNRFKYYANNDQSSSGLKGKIITCFYERRNGEVWIGTSGGGLSKFDRESGTFQTYTVNNGLSSNDIYDIKEDESGNLWIGTWNGGLLKFESKRNQFTAFLNDPSDPNSLIYNNVKSVLAEDSVIWIGTHGEGLAVYDLRMKQFIHRKNNKIFPFDMGKPSWINHLMRDSKNRIWICTYNGVFVYNRKELLHFSKSDSSNSLSNNSVNMAMEDKDGRIWVMNEKGGIDLFQEDGTFERFYQSDHGSKAFTVDDEGKMWVSSTTGINRIDLKDKTAKRFDESDGLIAHSFFHKAVMKSRSGHLFFGSSYGFNVFHQDSIKAVDYTVIPYLTSLHIYDELVRAGDGKSPLKKVLNFSDTLCLSYEQSFFTIGFTTTNLFSGDRARFAYQLEGLHRKWISENGSRKASFTNLDPGTYKFRLKYTDAEGEWIESPKVLTIIIQPPWWLTTWFKALAGMIMVGAVILIFYIRLYSIKQRNRQLEAEVSRRTQDLSEANFFLVERNEEINRQSDKILLQQEQIVTQNQELEKSIAEARKLHQIKDRFFSILAHDLRNPIANFSGITDTLKMNLPKLEKREIDKHVDALQRSAHGIFNLLTNLLHWSATHGNNLDHSPTDFQVDKLIRNNAQLLEQQFQQKQIMLNIMVNTSHVVFADYNMLDTVIRNLLTNCIKFTYERGEVTVQSIEMDEEIMLVISDNGIGMTREQIENLFNVERQNFTKGTQGETGTGLGLIIAREFVQANKGSIHVESELGRGTTFTIRIPKSFQARRDITLIETKDKSPTVHMPSENELPIEDLIKMRGKKVLLVEDNSELLAHLKLYLSSTFEIFEAHNGREGFNIALEIHPTAIISDLTMPVMDGVAFCRAIKKNPDTSHIPFILLTSNSSDESHFSGYDAGADVYLTKPVKRNLLFRVILNFIENQERLRQRILDTNGFLTNEPVINKSDEEFLDRVIAIVEEHISDPSLDYKIIADRLAMSKSVLYSKLKAITGQGIQEFIKSIRLKKSLKYLTDGKLPINEIASLVGFSSQSYFNKCFIKQFEMTPKTYMNKNKRVVAL